jgi:hypothetical protein
MLLQSLDIAVDKTSGCPQPVNPAIWKDAVLIDSTPTLEDIETLGVSFLKAY